MFEKFPEKGIIQKICATHQNRSVTINQAIMRDPCRNNLRLLLLPALLLLLVLPAQLRAENADPAHHHGAGPQEASPPIHEHPAAPAIVANGQVGLDERLGQHIPLDIPFRDEQGQVVTLSDYVAGPTIIAPVYYGCPNVCNFLQGGLARALPKVALRPGEQYQVLSISFDETETPEMARRAQNNYLAAIGGDFPAGGWHFLTGDAQEIRRLTDALGFYFQRQGQDFLHPVAVVVVAADGKIIRYLHGTHFLPMDVTLALVEAGEGRVGSTIRKMATFCFTYDPENRRYVFNLLRVSGTAILLTVGGFLVFLIVTGRKGRR